MQQHQQISRQGQLVGVLLMTLLLVVLVLRGASHHHPGVPAPGETLCAVCIHAAGGLGTAQDQAPPAAPPQRHSSPESRFTPEPAFIAELPPSIRGPPAQV